MNMKKTIAAVAASAMAISAIAVPANAAVENAVATGTSFTYSLVKEFKVDAAGSANLVARFNANPSTDTITISLKGLAQRANVTISANASDAKTLTFTPEGPSQETNFPAGITYSAATSLRPYGIITFTPGSFSNADENVTFVVTGLYHANGLYQTGSSHAFEKAQLAKDAAVDADYLNVDVTTTKAGEGSYAAATVTEKEAAGDAARAAELADIIRNLDSTDRAAAAGAADTKALAAVKALDETNSALTDADADFATLADIDNLTDTSVIKESAGALTSADSLVPVGAITIAQDAYDAAYDKAYTAWVEEEFKFQLDTAYDYAYDNAVGDWVDGTGTPSTTYGAETLQVTNFVAAGTQIVKMPYKSFTNGGNTGSYNKGPADIITWLNTKVAAPVTDFVNYWNNDNNEDGKQQASEWETKSNVSLSDLSTSETTVYAENAYTNVQAVINDCIANYPNVTFTFNTATENVLDAYYFENNAKGWLGAANIDTYNSNGNDLYKNAFKQYIYVNYGSTSDASGYVPFDPGAYFTNGVGYNLFTGALVINDWYTMQLADTEMFSYNATSLVFDYQALKDNAYASYNTYLNMITSMKLATSIPWYWDSMTVSFAAAADDTADSDAGTSSEDEPLPEEPAEELPAEEVETLPAETEAPATEAPVAPAANPGTGNAPVALAVIPVALAAAAIIAKKRK